MTDEHYLLLVIWFLYISECFLWVEKHSFAIISSWGRNWKFAFPSVFFGNARGGLVFLNPLYPFTTKVFKCHLFPVSLSPIGICAYNSQLLSNVGRPFQTGQWIEYKDIHSVELFKNEVHINNSCFVKCKITQHAELIKDILLSVIKITEKDRIIIINNFIHKMLNYQEAHSIINKYNKLSLNLRIICFVWFLLLLFIFPVIVWQFGIVKTIIPIVILMIYFAILISFKYYYLHKLLYPMSKEHLISNIIKMILCPPTAISANDKLSLNLVAFYDPLCLASILLKRGKLGEYANRLILDLKYPIKIELTNKIPLAINFWHRRNFIDIYEEFLNKLNISELRTIKAHYPLDVQNKSYCPRCLSQFKLDKGECPDCMGIKLVKFGKNLYSRKGKFNE